MLAQSIKDYNITCMAKEKRMNNSWKLTSGWRELKQHELKTLREAKVVAQRTSIKIKTTQL